MKRMMSSSFAKRRKAGMSSNFHVPIVSRSVAPIRISVCIHTQRAESFPVAGECLGNAIRVGDGDVRQPQPCERKAHGDAVIVVGIDDTRARRFGQVGAAIDDEVVAVLAGEARADGVEAGG